MAWLCIMLSAERFLQPVGEMPSRSTFLLNVEENITKVYTESSGAFQAAADREIQYQVRRLRGKLA